MSQNTRNKETTTMGLSTEKPQEIHNLLVENYIHSCKSKGKSPNEKGLIPNLENIRMMELLIATK